jgi:hypothetical protein
VERAVRAAVGDREKAKVRAAVERAEVRAVLMVAVRAAVERGRR